MADERSEAVNAYCQILWDWLDLVVAEAARREADGRVSTRTDHLNIVAAAASSIRIAVTKSNYLSRRLYAGEKHRTRKCPTHDGHWSGYAFPNTCECSLGVYDITGWLPEPGDEQPDLGTCGVPGCDQRGTVQWQGETGSHLYCPQHENMRYWLSVEAGHNVDYETVTSPPPSGPSEG